MKVVGKLSVFLLLAALVGLSGCASNRGWESKYHKAMSNARSSYDLHDYAKAKQLYREAAEINPTRAEPWAQLANINFYQQNYGRAIVGAREALHRDPGAAEAQTILTAAGLRVAIEALGQMHNSADLKGPARDEAQNLAEKMRSVLGEDILSSKRHSSARRVVKKQKRPAPKPKAEAEPKSEGYSNPFGFLPQG